MMSKQPDVSAIATRLDAMLRLMLDQQRKSEGLNIGDQILILEDSGLSQADAGRILGIDGNQIPSYLLRAQNEKLRDKLSKKRKER